MWKFRKIKIKKIKKAAWAYACAWHRAGLNTGMCMQVRIPMHL